MDELKYLSNIDDLMDLHEFMRDDDLGHALNLVIRFITTDSFDPTKAARYITLFEAYAVKFRMMAISNTHIKPTAKDAKTKKNVYYSASEQCHNFSVALKSYQRGI